MAVVCPSKGVAFTVFFVVISQMVEIQSELIHWTYHPKCFMD